MAIQNRKDVFIVSYNFVCKENLKMKEVNKNNIHLFTQILLDIKVINE